MEEYKETHDKEGRHFKVKIGVVEVGVLNFDGLYFFEFTNYGSKEQRIKAIDKLNGVYNFENC